MRLQGLTPTPTRSSSINNAFHCKIYSYPSRTAEGLVFYFLQLVDFLHKTHEPYQVVDKNGLFLA